MSSMSFTPMHSAFCSLRSAMGAMLRAVVGMLSVLAMGTERGHLAQVTDEIGKFSPCILGWLNPRELDLRTPNWSGEDRNIPGLT
jgi:hypothetical protein